MQDIGSCPEELFTLAFAVEILLMKILLACATHLMGQELLAQIKIVQPLAVALRIRLQPRIGSDDCCAACVRPCLSLRQNRHCNDLSGGHSPAKEEVSSNVDNTCELTSGANKGEFFDVSAVVQSSSY